MPTKLGQGNVFTGGYVKGDGYVNGRGYVQGDGVDTQPHTPPIPWALDLGYHWIRSASGRYTSYWNAFLFYYPYTCVEEIESISFNLTGSKQNRKNTICVMERFEGKRSLGDFGFAAHSHNF